MTQFWRIGGLFGLCLLLVACGLPRGMRDGLGEAAQTAQAALLVHHHVHGQPPAPRGLLLLLLLLLLGRCGR